jgi:hypothetical protein
MIAMFSILVAAIAFRCSVINAYWCCMCRFCTAGVVLQLRVGEGRGLCRLGSPNQCVREIILPLIRGERHVIASRRMVVIRCCRCR